MTLVIAAYGKDFVILAADSRGTLRESDGGTRVELNRYRKLRHINDRVGLLMYGDANFANYLVEQFGRDNDLSRLGVTSFSHKFAKFARDELAKVPIISRGAVPPYGYIIAGLEQGSRRSAAPRCLGLYSANGFHVCEYDRFAIEGKPILANYLFAKGFFDDMDEEELSSLVAQAIYDTRKVDGDVGGSIHMTIIDRKGLRPVDASDIDKMIDQWENPPERPSETEDSS